MTVGTPVFRDSAELLQRLGIFTAPQIDHILQEQRKTGESLMMVALAAGFVDEERLIGALSQNLGVPAVDLDQVSIDPAARALVPTKVVFQHCVMPISAGEKVLQVAVCDPFNLNLLNTLQLVSGRRVEQVLAPRADIEKTARKYYGVGADTVDRMMQQDRISLEALDEEAEAEDLDEEASVVKFVNQVIREAYQDRATDIHFEPMEGDLRIRYRIDGVLHQTPVPPQLKLFQAAIISRIKVMARMNIAEKRLPQDGRISMQIGPDELDIRVSTIPTVYGESVSLRLLSRSSILLGLDRLGLRPEDQEIVHRLIRRPHGIILVTGPTGSGKSTTLYAFLNTINSIDKRIITTEEPVEYELPGVNQMEVRPEIDLTFARGLRHILRQDPDVIMVGEIRDLETAEIAIRAALTGHLVFSTLHTNDAAGGVTRLLDMGIEPYLVTSSVDALIAQRLVRTICPSCRESYDVDPKVLERAGFAAEYNGGLHLHRGAGCEECKYSGYKGRTGIYEVMRVTEPIRSLIIERASSTKVKQQALALGMRTLRDDGWGKVLEGITTLEEVVRVTQEDEALVG